MKNVYDAWKRLPILRQVMESKEEVSESAVLSVDDLDTLQNFVEV